MLLRHWELEEHFLAPLLNSTTGDAEPMTREHRSQREQLSRAVELLDGGAANPEAFAQKLQTFTDLVREDIEREQRHLQTLAASPDAHAAPHAPVQRIL